MAGIYVLLWVPDEGRPHQEMVVIEDRLPLLAACLVEHLRQQQDQGAAS